MDPATSLRTLADRPFELLQEMERRARRGAGDAAEKYAEWVGVAFRVGKQNLVAPREEVREILKLPPVTRVPGAQRWMLGLVNVRGQLYPLVDLKLFCGERAMVASRGTRVIIVNHHDVPMGVLVDEVFGFRRFIATDHDESREEIDGRMRPFVDGAFCRDGEVWPLFSFTQLTDSDELLKAAV